MNLLDVSHVNKAFGGLQASNDISLTVGAGERVAVIGPNGAGKSTLFNLISGALTPDSGRIEFYGRSIVGMAPHRIARIGIGRSFQRSNIFTRLTAFENVLTAVLSQTGRSRDPLRALARHRTENERAESILARIGLADDRDRLAGKLALGDQKRLEIGLALAMEPRLLLLDEPTAGMSPEETAGTVALVESLARETGISLLFTEHDMAVVFGVAERLYVLHQGTIIASGTPDAIRANADVQRIYLGEAP
ncbi:MAG: ABC transporter ATP-binding protein [Chloroflexota bacterium]|nr:ABC transporter ATP-binding protein [Chloroflexota bacterium]